MHHVRLLFQREGIPAKLELTACTSVAGFSIGLGAKTACSSFRIYPNATWGKELVGEVQRQLEEQLINVVLLIVDEISFIGRVFFACMHFRVQQPKRRRFSEAALGPDELEFGNIPIMLVGDFGLLETIDDLSLCDTETTFQVCPRGIRHLWRYASHDALLRRTLHEAIMLRRIHRSQEDVWWTESCLRLRDFTCMKKGAYDIWRDHELGRGPISTKPRRDFSRTKRLGCVLAARTSVAARGVSSIT